MRTHTVPLPYTEAELQKLLKQPQAILGHSTLDMTCNINLYGNGIQRDFDRLNPSNNIRKKGQESSALLLASFVAIG